MADRARSYLHSRLLQNSTVEAYQIGIIAAFHWLECSYFLLLLCSYNTGYAPSGLWRSASTLSTSNEQSTTKDTALQSLLIAQSLTAWLTAPQQGFTHSECIDAGLSINASESKTSSGVKRGASYSVNPIYDRFR